MDGNQYSAGQPGFGAEPQGAAQSGPTQAGPTQTGPTQTGPTQTGPHRIGPPQSGPQNAAQGGAQPWPATPPPAYGGAGGYGAAGYSAPGSAGYGASPGYGSAGFGSPGIGSAPGYGGVPGYGPPAGPGFNLGTFGPARIAGIVVAVAGLLVLIGSLLSLYTITVVPSAAAIPDNDAPSGEIRIGIGFYDIVPMLTPSIVAQLIPVLMVLAALCAIPEIIGRDHKTTPLAAVFSGTAALLALVLVISRPLPSVTLTGQLLTEFQKSVSTDSIDSLVDSVGSVGPGAGLIMALIFGLVGWAAAAFMVFKESKQASAGPAPQPPAGIPAGMPPNITGMPPNMPPSAPMRPQW